MDKRNRSAYQKQYQRERYRKIRKELVERLGGKCVVCGSTENLSFDHINPSSKEKTISKIWCYSKEKLEEEITKCQLLCSRCHNNKTLAEKGHHNHKQDGIKHGSSTAYINYKCKCEVCRKAQREAARKNKNGSVDERLKSLDF